MLKLKFHASRAVSVNGGEWVGLTRTEFLLLEFLCTRPNKLVAFSEIQRHLWGFDDPEESPTLVATRNRLLAQLRNTSADTDWEDVIRRDEVRGHGIFLRATRDRGLARAASENTDMTAGGEEVPAARGDHREVKECGRERAPAIKVEARGTRIARVNGGDWVSLPRDEFHLLVLFTRSAKTTNKLLRSTE